MSLQIVPFDDALIPPAGALLAVRHQRLRAGTPELPARFEDAEVARTALAALWRRDRTDGVAALSGNRMLGYLIGDIDLKEVWGRSAWVRFAGCALAPDQDVELVRDL